MAAQMVIAAQMLVAAVKVAVERLAQEQQRVAQEVNAAEMDAAAGSWQSCSARRQHFPWRAAQRCQSGGR